eukprot:Lithocolla_globosa_v1_NODE_3_length_14236_cov_22.745998.p17 type:complete len:107 gc:universal NODE_3_length_14236_cov_22.745998:8477-8797(+)
MVIFVCRVLVTIDLVFSSFLYSRQSIAVSEMTCDCFTGAPLFSAAILSRIFGIMSILKNKNEDLPTRRPFCGECFVHFRSNADSMAFRNSHALMRSENCSVNSAWS